MFYYIEMIITALSGLFGAFIGAKSAAYFQNKNRKSEILKEVYANVFSAVMGLMNHASAQTRLVALSAVERAFFDCSEESYDCMCSLLKLAEKPKEDSFYNEIDRLHKLAVEDISQYEPHKKTRKNHSETRSNDSQNHTDNL